MSYPDEPYTAAEKLVIDQVWRDVASPDKDTDQPRPARSIVSRQGEHWDVNLSKQGLTRLPLAVLQKIDQYVKR